ncbi:hypothetical protein Taro_029660 [Colocasia esculenta]|uniref:Uncharacterized protein n=1 Tax=Colocasia esculenta TaxID=4460 RepID=A0A843VTV1_COLES|nr:hypothetical protein [Colocasia esculenta]
MKRAHWSDETEPRGIGRKTCGKVKTVDWRTHFPKQFADWHRGGQVVVSDATDSTAYLRRFQEEYGARDFMRPERDGRDTLIGQLEGQLAEARVALETLVTCSPGGGRLGRCRWGLVEQGPSSGGVLLPGAVDCGRGALRASRTRSPDTDRGARGCSCSGGWVTQPETELPRDVAELRALLALERRDLERQQARWELERSRWELDWERLTQQSVEARTSHLVVERLLKASEDRYRSGRERVREQGRASAYSESILATSSQHERNVQDGATAQRSTSSRAPMGPPALPTVVDQGEAESSHRRGPTEGGDERNDDAEEEKVESRPWVLGKAVKEEFTGEKAGSRPWVLGKAVKEEFTGEKAESRPWVLGKAVNKASPEGENEAESKIKFPCGGNGLGKAVKIPSVEGDSGDPG